MRNVALQVYPLRADMAVMRQFIDSYLNFVDDEYSLPFYFKPAMPYVMLQILYYPYLAVTTGNTVWLTQREVSFSVPLECYRVDRHGKRVFNHYATCSPFLYLDVQPTITSGRDIFGLPKVALRFQPLEPFFRPEEPSLLTDLRLRCTGPAGDEFNPLLKVFQDPPRFTSTNIVNDTLTTIPSAARSWIAMMTGVWEQTVQPPARGYERTRDLASILEMSRAGVDLVTSSLPAFSLYRSALEDYESTADIQLGPMNIDMVSLKQFRDAEKTDYACYQSLVSSLLYMDRINAGGSLADPLSRDLSGGIFVKIHDIPSQPLINSLGLVTDSRVDAEGGSVWTIRPQSPFWLNVDLSYSLGVNLSWRTMDRSWSAGEAPGHKAREMTQYNTFGSGALQEVAQRMISPEASILILALPLDKDGPQKITKLCREYFCNDRFEFEPWLLKFCPDPDPTKEPLPEDKVDGGVIQFGDELKNWREVFARKAEGTLEVVLRRGRIQVQRQGHNVIDVGESMVGGEVESKPKGNPEECASFIYMIVYDVLNSREGAGLSTEHDVELAVPFKWFRKENKDQTIGYGVFPVYAFSDSEEATITQSEVFGRPTVLADISGVILDAMAARRKRYTHSPVKLGDALIVADVGDPTGATEPTYPMLRPNYQQPVLNVNTAVLGALYSGDQPKDRTVIQLVEGPATPKYTKAGQAAVDYLNQPNDYMAPWAGLKQVVDCRLPKRASYQSIVMQGMKIKRLKPPGQSESVFDVRIGRYQALPIVQTLGLKVAHSNPGQDTTIDTVEAAFAVWIRVDIEEQPALNLCSRAGDSPWCNASNDQIRDKKLDNQNVAQWIHNAVPHIKAQRGYRGSFMVEYPPAGSTTPPPTTPPTTPPASSVPSGPSTPLNPTPQLQPQTTPQTETVGDGDKKKGE
jgi:hypothetical protein